MQYNTNRFKFLLNNFDLSVLIIETSLGGKQIPAKKDGGGGGIITCRKL